MIASPRCEGGLARLDGPAGSQIADSVIEAMSDWMRSGSQANHGGQFKQAHETDELVESTRKAVRHPARRRARRASSSARASRR